jgi:choline dehydrogenase-like flavoprotein
VVGAGPLGIVVALELARRGHRVALLESGGARYDAATQALARTVGADPYHAAMDIAVRRQVGGTSNIWGGRCVPFDPIDFEAHASAPKWPVSYEEIAAYYQRACDWCVIGKAIFDARAITELADRRLVPGLPDGRVVSSALERWSLPTNFGRVYGRELAHHEHIDLITGLTCTQIVTATDGTAVDHIVARSLAGPTATVHAQCYVLATGGLDAVRLLFASDGEHPDGIGNHAGHLGRGYMAHVEGRVARLCLTTPPDETIYGHERDRDGVYVRRRFTFARERLLELGMPNAAVWLVNPELGDASHGSPVLSFVYLVLRSPLGRFAVADAIRQLHVRTTRPPRLRDHLLNVARGLVPATRFAVTFGYERYLRPGRKVPGFFVKSQANEYPLMYHGEHISHADSFVEPTGERDALGLPRFRTHLHYSRDDISSVRRAMEELDGYVREHRVGRVEFLYPDVDVAMRRCLQGGGGYHQTGITRMSELPEDGVVDRNLAVHGFRDLYIASTSTFPSSGQANPTFTGIAFAVRLADHLDGLLSGSREQPEATSPDLSVG